MQEVNEITSEELQRLASRYFSVNISAPTIRRYIHMDAPEVGSCTHKVWPDDFRCEQGQKKWICKDMLGHRRCFWERHLDRWEFSASNTSLPDNESENKERASSEACCETCCQGACVGWDIRKRGHEYMRFQPNNGWCVIHTNFGTVSAALYRETLSWHSVSFYARQWFKAYKLSCQRLNKRASYGGQHLPVVQILTQSNVCGGN